MKPILSWGVSAVLFAALPLAMPVVAAELPILELNAGIHRVEAEVASNGSSREEGLMYRRQLGPSRGMLFVFPQAARHCMWMRNTYLPLSVAFLDEQGAILNVEDMQPQTENNHCATKPARFALEMNLGWFQKRGIGSGQRIAGVDRAPPPR
jgi:uncharacterized protein